MSKTYFILGILFSSLFSFSQNAEKSINVLDADSVKQGYWEEHEGFGFSKGVYFNGSKDGVWCDYLTNDLLHEVQGYKKGLKDGVHIVIDKRGYLKKEEHFKNDLLDGVSRIYTYGANLTSYEEYEKGLLNGIKKVFYSHRPGIMLEQSNPDGKVKLSGKYKNGEKDGKWIEYDEDGKKINTERY